MIGTRKRERGWGLHVDFYQKFNKSDIGSKKLGEKIFYMCM